MLAEPDLDPQEAVNAPTYRNCTHLELGRVTGGGMGGGGGPGGQEGNDVIIAHCLATQLVGGLPNRKAVSYDMQLIETLKIFLDLEVELLYFEVRPSCLGLIYVDSPIQGL